MNYCANFIMAVEAERRTEAERASSETDEEKKRRLKEAEVGF